MPQEVTVKNAKRSRKFGLGVSTTPTGHGSAIAPPSCPQYVGTVRQIRDQMARDRRYLSSIQSLFKTWRVFYDGRPIQAVWRVGRDLRTRDPLEDIYKYGWFRVSSVDELEEALADDGSLTLMD